MMLDAKRRAITAAALLVVEYLLVSVLFDARELVPASLKGIGDLAPMPLIAGVAVLILRASTTTTTTTTATTTAATVDVASLGALPAPLATRTLVAFAAAHIVTFAAFIGASFALRSASEPSVAPSLAWAACGALSATLLAAFALARGGLLEVAKRSLAPLGVGALVGVAAWAAGRGTGELWHPLARLTLYPVGVLVELLSDDVVGEPDKFIVGTERFTIRIDPVCSGYEGMGLVAVLVAAFVWTFHRELRFPHALLLVGIGVFAAFLANVIRITALIYVGALGSPEVAVSGFHSKAGWLLFCVVALGTTWLARDGRFFQRRDASSTTAPPAASSDAKSASNATAGYLAPLLALVAGTLTAGLAADDRLDQLEVVALVAACGALVWARAAVRVALSAPPDARARWLGVGVGAGVFVMWMALDAFSSMPSHAASSSPHAADGSVADQLASWPPAAVFSWVALRLVGSIAIAPLVEELAFRGFLLRRIVAADFVRVRYADITALAVLTSSVAFGALHDRWLAGSLAGIAYAFVVWRTGQLRDAVIAHAVTNALIAVVVLAFGKWALWT